MSGPAWTHFKPMRMPCSWKTCRRVLCTWLAWLCSLCSALWHERPSVNVLPRWLTIWRQSLSGEMLRRPCEHSWESLAAGICAGLLHCGYELTKLMRVYCALWVLLMIWSSVIIYILMLIWMNYIIKSLVNYQILHRFYENHHTFWLDFSRSLIT